MWEHFVELHRTRGSNGWAPSPIRYVDLDAYQRVRGVEFDAWAIDVIIKLDTAYFEQQMKNVAVAPPATKRPKGYGNG